MFALIEELYPNIGDIRSLYEEKEALCRKWMEEGGVPVLPGVYHTLGLLKALGVKQCVCTSTSRDSAEKTLTSAGILPKLDALMCGDDLEKSKPDPQIFLRGAQKLNTPIEECAVVEDAPAGVEAGLRSGARVFIVPGMLEMPQEFEAALHADQQPLGASDPVGGGIAPLLPNAEKIAIMNKITGNFEEF